MYGTIVGIKNIALIKLHKMTEDCKSPNIASPTSTPSPTSPDGPNVTPGSNVRLLKTPRSGMSRSTKLRQAFKSPFQPKQTDSTLPSISTKEETASLKRKIESLDEEINSMQKEYDISELQDHIDKLHEYNDIKDAGQLILGKLAEIEGKTTKALYEEFGLDIDD